MKLTDDTCYSQIPIGDSEWPIIDQSFEELTACNEPAVSINPPFCENPILESQR